MVQKSLVRSSTFNKCDDTADLPIPSNVMVPSVGGTDREAQAQSKAGAIAQRRLDHLL